MWPYSYDSCDLGTFINQTSKTGVPAAAATGGAGGSQLSGLPGQRLSACSCPGSDHPGPKYNVGRGVPEVDIIETQVDVSRYVGQVSQSYQCAPYNYQYNFDGTSPATTIYDSSVTTLNSYKGGPLQQAVSALTDISPSVYGGNGYATYGYELWADPNHRSSGYITWYSNGKPSWQITSATVGPDPTSEVNQRLIPEEPMVRFSYFFLRGTGTDHWDMQYLILNLGLSPSFQKQDFKHLAFPSVMYVDYVRIYQRQGIQNGITCDPPNRPTANYISQ